MSVETELRARLIADATVNGLVGTRIYPEVLPQNPTLPAITYQDISMTSVQNLAGAAGMLMRRVQIDSFAATRVGVVALADAIRASLDGYIGTLTTTKVVIRHALERSEYDDETESYRQIQDYTVHYPD